MTKKRPQRTGTVVQRGKDRWELRVWDKYAGKTQTRTVTAYSRSEAHDRCTEFVAEMIGGKLSNAPAGFTLGQLADEWLALQRVGHQTEQTYAYSVKVIKRHAIGSFPIRTLDLDGIERFVSDLCIDMAPDTVRTIMGGLRSILRLARRRSLLRPNLVFEDVKTPRSRSRHTLAPHDVLVQRFMDALPPDHRDIALLLAFSGMRRQELCGLQVGDVNLHHPEGARATVIRVVQRGGGKRLNSAAKTRAGERTFALGDEAVAILARRIEIIQEQAGDDPRLFLFSPNPRADDFWAVDSVTQFFRRAREQAGMDSDIRPHMLRHWAATKAANAGVPLPELMARFGWTDKRTALRYSHATGGWDKAAANATEAALTRHA